MAIPYIDGLPIEEIDPADVGDPFVGEDPAVKKPDHKLMKKTEPENDGKDTSNDEEVRVGKNQAKRYQDTKYEDLKDIPEKNYGMLVRNKE